MTTAAKRGSNNSDVCKSFLNAADPAKIKPDTFGRSLVMNKFVEISATRRK